MRHLNSYVLFASVAQPAIVLAHARWKCPEPRNEDTGIKSGPCGPDTNDFTANDNVPLMEIKPGPMRVIFEESVSHTGSPFRIALSGDGSDEDDTCVLLDHIPHHDNASQRPRLIDPSTYTPYVITIDIPDVKCERCSLHLANPMTDKISLKGSPTGIGCTDPDGTCFSVYHSCTIPFRIAGTISRSEYVCPAQESIDDWPKHWVGDYGQIVDTNTQGVYRRESALWNAEMFTLDDAPLRYRQDAGVICGAKDNIEEGVILAEDIDLPLDESAASAMPESSAEITDETVHSSNGTGDGDSHKGGETSSMKEEERMSSKSFQISISQPVLLTSILWLLNA
mmetsp:Transcript_23179/g.35162  ORF Transcript_23179/g.35162 Transcript_23179/m.35162 type:complete len:339 (+) Transcript_23179:79-1095(+)